MRTLVIGGTGLLSKAVAIEAMAAGHDVAVVTRGKRPPLAGAKAIVADRNEVAAFAAAFDGQTFDLVIDCIGFTAAHAEQDVTVFGSRTRQLVFISTDFVFDPTERPRKIDETYGRFEPSLPYGVGKRAAEVLLMDAHRDGKTRGMAVAVLRPCHIYGPEFLLGCLPKHGRDPELLAKLKRGDPIALVGGGHFLQQPVAAVDIAKAALSCYGNTKAAGEIFMCAGPDVVDSRGYYRILADLVGMPLNVVEVPITEHLTAHPDHKPFCCHRVYDMGKARRLGLRVPSTPLRDGLVACVAAKNG